MTPLYRIASAETADDLKAAAMLFEAYAASLSVDLGYQHFEAELAGLPGPYAAPRGALLIARDEAGAPLASVGLRPLKVEGCCEMKRLYVVPAGRGVGLGRAMAGAAIAEARRIGYAELRLDTLPSMDTAIRLYRDMGFEPAEPYYAPTPAGTLFMALNLSPDRAGRARLRDRSRL